MGETSRETYYCQADACASWESCCLCILRFGSQLCDARILGSRYCWIGPLCWFNCPVPREERWRRRGRLIDYAGGCEAGPCGSSAIDDRTRIKLEYRRFVPLLNIHKLGDNNTSSVKHL